MHKLTLKKLAADLGLSVSTVSKALNDSYEISAETKKKVQQYAKSCNYKPNILASSLKSGKSHTLAVIIPFLSNPFQSQLLEGAQKAAFEENYKLIFMQTNENCDLEKECLEFLKSQNIDGVLITPSANSDINFLKNYIKTIPLVLVDRIDFDLDTYKIGVDNAKGMYLATEHFITKGIEKIFLIVGENIGVTNARVLGYKNALLTCGRAYSEDSIIRVDYGQSREELITNLTALLKKTIDREEGKIGLLTTTDTLTVLSLSILSQLNVSVPTKVSLLGFSNMLDTIAMNPALSTIVQPAEEIGYIGIKKLLLRIKANNSGLKHMQTILLDTTMILRKSG